MSGPSHIYVRMLQGKVTSERYVAVVRRAVRMSGKPWEPASKRPAALVGKEQSDEEG